MATLPPTWWQCISLDSGIRTLVHQGAHLGLGSCAGKFEGAKRIAVPVRISDCDLHGGAVRRPASTGQARCRGLGLGRSADPAVAIDVPPGPAGRGATPSRQTPPTAQRLTVSLKVIPGLAKRSGLAKSKVVQWPIWKMGPGGGEVEPATGAVDCGSRSMDWSVVHRQRKRAARPRTNVARQSRRSRLF